MSLSTLTSRDLSRIQKLIQRKEALATEIDEINQELQSIESGDNGKPKTATGPTARAATAPKPAKAAAASAAGRGGRKARAGKTGRGVLKEKITSELRAAGKEGVKVKDLADKLGSNYGNITAFFQSTGKNIKEIKKIGPARFAWVGA